MSQEIMSTETVWIPVARLADPKAYATIKTYDKNAVIGWIDENGRVHGGSVTLYHLAFVLFPTDETGG